jgi:hypothetical protein
MVTDYCCPVLFCYEIYVVTLLTLVEFNVSLLPCKSILCLFIVCLVLELKEFASNW